MVVVEFVGDRVLVMESKQTRRWSLNFASPTLRGTGVYAHLELA